MKLEKRFEEKRDSWGEAFGEQHRVHMEPLFPHLQETENEVIKKAKQIGEDISRGFENFKNSFFDHPFKVNPPWKGHKNKYKFNKRNRKNEDDLDDALSSIDERI